MSRTLSNASADDRPATDFYSTPPEATAALMRWWKVPKDSHIWECACGNGMMARELQKFCPIVTASDLHEYGFGLDGVDFLTCDMPEGVEFVITNPPFNQSQAFIERAASLPLKGFAMLLKSQYWHAAKRMALFAKHPPSAVLPLTWRPDFLHGAKGGAPTMEVLWTVWEPVARPTIYSPLPKP